VPILNDFFENQFSIAEKSKFGAASTYINIEIGLIVGHIFCHMIFVYIREASWSPLMISISRPVSAFTCLMMAGPFVASRMAEVRRL
jgi:hypothetical protein